MKFRHLQHYVGMIMVSSAFVLSTIFALIAYQFNQKQAEEESQRQVHSLLAAVKNTASAALFSANEAVGWDAINGLLGTNVIYSAELAGFADEVSPGMKISKDNELGGSPMPEISIELESIFDQDQILGILRVRPNRDWVNQRTRETSIPIILGVILVVSLSFFVSARAIKLKISEPLVSVRRKLKDIHADSADRLTLPDHLQTNEIGVLVSGFNELLDETNAAFEIERRLRKQMEVVQNSLKVAKAEAESAAQAKSDFLATMSHEIRTPLSGVLGMLSFVLKDPNLHEKSREQIDIAHSNAKALLTIINDILDISKMEAGKLSIEMMDFDFRKEINAAVAVFGDMARDKSLEFNLNIQSDVPDYVKSDPTRIRQVLVNLIGNGLKFTSEGSVTVDIEVLESNQNTARIRFAVTDSGIGISEDNIAKLFQKFEQADVSTTRQYGGTGLGLSICKMLVEIMGGQIGVTSIEGQGSTFFFEIPVETGCAATVAAEEREQVPHTHKLHILCAEDFATNQVIIRTLLEDMGHEVDIAENGREAIEMLIAEEFDVILMDGRMPEMDGLEATRFIRSGRWNDQEIKQSDIKVVALTANVTNEDRERYLASGMNAFLSKPVDEVELHHILEDTINELLEQNKSLNPLIRVSTSELDNLFALPTDSPSEDEKVEVEAVQAKPVDDLSTKLRAAFIDSLPERIDEINTAMEEENCEELGRLFHGIKGSAGYLEDDALVALAGELEKRADNIDLVSIQADFEQFLQQLKPYQEAK